VLRPALPNGNRVREGRWFLDIGAQAFQQALTEVGVDDDIVHFELFDAKHGGIDYRYPLSLAWLTDRLAP
jgi:hypothetical protein